MTNLIVDGFAHYGTTAENGTTAVKQAMLAGAWAGIGNGFDGIHTLPWDLANTDLYALFPANGDGARRVLPVSIAQTDAVIASFYFATSSLPPNDNDRFLIDFSDGGNQLMSYLKMRPTGVLRWTNDGITGSTFDSSGPVIVAETITHIEIKFVPGTGANGTVEVRANGAVVISATNMAVPHHAPVEIFSLGSNGIFSFSTAYYISHLIIRNTAGAFNNDFVGDRRVATLLVNADDVAHQGWTARSLHKFGNGILANGISSSPGGAASNNAGVLCGVTTDTNLGNLDYTLEGHFRFQRMPTGSNKAVVFGKWDETANQRSYQLYLGGPTLNNGDLVFRISTDGTNGTATTLFSYPWKPIVGQWYHIAVDRESGVTNVYVDGVQLGTGFTDTNIYFAGTAHTALMVQVNGITGVANTALDGWNDEFRITQATSRYSGAFSPPVAAFPRGPIDDPAWSDVAWLSGWDQASVDDDSGFARPLSAINGAAAVTPPDGAANYQVIDKNYANDDSFIEASLLFAESIFTQTSQPADTKTVTIGTTDGSTPAVYTWETVFSDTAFSVLIGGTLFESLTNLMNAMIGGPGIGTTYGTGTTDNFDVTAEQLPVNQLFIQALTAGTVGNSIACSTDDTNGSFPAANLEGGLDIPGYSQFKTQRLPPGASVVDSITIVRRSWKTDAGTCTVRASFVGPADGVVNGSTVAESTAPTLRHDTIETDPDNPGGALTPTAILLGRLRIDRTS